jgi:thiol-disulfide isomerase/thioredoxin
LTIAPPASELARPASRLGRRVVLWISLAVGLAVAVLVVVLATVGSPSDRSHLVGAPAPALSGPALAGPGHVSLAQYAGRWVLVDFAASWCVDCREELPFLKAFDATARRYDATVLTVEEDPPDAGALARYMATNDARWAAVQDPEASATYGVTQIPAIYLVDPDGIVVAYYPAGIDPTSLDGVITSAIHAGAGAAGSSS